MSTADCPHSGSTLRMPHHLDALPPTGMVGFGAPMFHEVAVFSMLDSPLHRALVHVVGVTGPAVEADVTALRLLDAGNVAHATHVDAQRLGLPDATARALNEWPVYPNSIFEHLRRRHQSDDVFRFDPPTVGPSGTGQRLFSPIDRHVKIVDAVCAAFGVEGGSRCLAVYLRCGRRLPFHRQQVQLLERLRPQIQRVVRSGYCQETGIEVAAGEPSHPTYSAEAARLLARLTRTEFEVFGHLRTDATEKQIARTLNRSPHTVHVHVKSIYRKLGVRSRRMLNDLK